MARSSLVWFRISIAARRMSSSWSRISSSAASITRGPPILASASAARLRTHQSSSLIDCSSSFTCAARADLVQHLDRGAAGILVLVPQHGDQVPHRVRVVGAHDRVDRLLLRLDVRVAQDFAEQADVDVAFEAGQRVQHGLPHELVGVLQLPLQRRGDVALVEARQDVDDVRARDRVLALEAAQQFRDDARVGDFGDDAEHGRLLGRVLVVRALQHVARIEARLLRGEDADDRALRHRRLVEQAEQQVGGVIARIGQRGRGPGNGALVAFA